VAAGPKAAIRISDLYRNRKDAGLRSGSRQDSGGGIETDARRQSARLTPSRRTEDAYLGECLTEGLACGPGVDAGIRYRDRLPVDCQVIGRTGTGTAVGVGVGDGNRKRSHL